MATKLIWALYTAFCAWWSNPYDTQVVMGFFAVCTMWTLGWIIIGMHVESDRQAVTAEQQIGCWS